MKTELFEASESYDFHRKYLFSTCG